MSGQTWELVLLIDDDVPDNVLHKIVLMKHGATKRVECALSVDEALAFLRDHPTRPALIFLDINMPGKDGWQFLDEYHQLPQLLRADSAVYVLTTSSDPAERKRAEDNGVGFCSKPLTTAFLDTLL